MTSARSDANEPAIVIEHLTKRYPRGLSSKGRLAVDDVSLTIGRGESFALLGPNGSGKTTTLKILTTLLTPTSGSVRVLGLDVVSDAQRVRPRIGFVFGGDRGLYTRLSGTDNLRYFAELYAIPPRAARARINAVLSLVGLEDRAGDKVERYSRGMRQRLHIARGLLHEPDVLFLDEPTIGLDPVGARDVRALVQVLAESGKTVFLTTHYLFEAEAICDRMAVLKQGRVIAEGDSRSVRLTGSNTVVEFVADGIPPDQLDRLRSVEGVGAVTVNAVELRQVVSVHCGAPDGIVDAIRALVGETAVRDLRVRESTLEDAYVRLVGD